ncbi:MAG: DUF4404 family protein [Verrucomicrobiales bacterium]|nr:DUF4404 family protein [Verrucomicrobiales bacterium]
MLDTLNRLRQTIEKNHSLKDEELPPLLELLTRLESEAKNIESENIEKVQHAIAATEAACSDDGNDDEGPLETLQNAIREIEAAHPKTAETLGRIGNILGRMGI